jgi:nucleoside-diphosphate-sugar epimerase
MRVLNSFIEKGLTGKIEMMDQGKAGRTYCYVSDAVEIMWNILLFGKQPIYNVGGFSNITIADLAKKIGKLLDAEVIMPKNDKKMTGAPDNVRLDMSRVIKEFNKRKNNFISLNEGLKKTVEWQKELYKIK